MSKEIACYSLDIPTDEFFDGMSVVPNYKKFELFTDLKGFLGVNIDYQHGIIHHLFDTLFPNFNVSDNSFEVAFLS